VSEEKRKRISPPIFLRDGSRRCREAITSIHIAVNAIPDLTELPHARNFPASRVPLDGDQNAGDAHEDKQSGQLRFQLEPGRNMPNSFD